MASNNCVPKEFKKHNVNCIDEYILKHMKYIWCKRNLRKLVHLLNRANALMFFMFEQMLIERQPQIT